MKSPEFGFTNEIKKIEEEEILKSEDLENPQENQNETIKPAEAIAKERGILERFGGKAKKVAGVLLLVSALSSSPGLVSEANAQEKSATTRVEQVQKQAINEANLTESSKWSLGIVQSARADMKKIKTAEDAEWLLRTHLGQFVSEFYIPTKGNVKEGSYGTKTRNYTEDDAYFLLQNAQEMKNIVEELNTQYGVDSFEHIIGQIDDMIEKSEIRTSYSYQKQMEAIERMKQKMKKRY